MDLRERLKTYGAGNAYPFHMPGHKRQKQPGSLFPYDLDITEIDGFDNLHHAEGILAEAMERAAKLWGSRKSFFLVNGSSAGLLAGIRALTKRGDKVLMARGCHRAVYHAVELCGLHPVYMQAAWVEEMQISGSIQPETVEKHLQEHPDCNLVILTSPTYEGVVSDIAEIAKIAHRYGAYLLVDEAHGAHLGFCEEGFPDTAVHLGADVVVQSLHKTLPCPTQTAILHVCTEQVDVTEVGRQLSVFQTSSPSYVFMAEMDGCISLLERERESLFAAYEKRLASFYEKMEKLEHIRLYHPENSSFVFGHDRGKLLFFTGNCNLSGVELSDILRERYELEMEMSLSLHTLAMTSIFDTDEGMERLAKAMLEIDKEVMPVKQPLAKGQMVLPQMVCGMEEALQGETTEVILQDSLGKIAADFLWAYPPGIPLVAPGERISEEVLAQAFYMQKNGVNIQCSFAKDGWIRVRF